MSLAVGIIAALLCFVLGVCYGKASGDSTEEKIQSLASRVITTLIFYDKGFIGTSDIDKLAVPGVIWIQADDIGPTPFVVNL